MTDRSNKDSVERYFDRVAAKDWPAVSALQHDEFVQEWPQMGERTRGRDNARAINEHHPGPPKGTIRRLHGAGDVWIAEATLRYGDGSEWTSAHIFEFKNGKIWRQTDYFGQPLPAPAWRAQWVERM
jgi:ketosteroid isomerase-like protein